jgi:glycosyltransferase involved in cell wall biosynthesis
LISQTSYDAERATISVITIFLNGERFISEAIESVLARDFRDFEIILVDDGSTHECTVIVRDYAAHYASVIRYLEHPGHQNRGMSASRNLGLKAVRGEFVAFVDADDFWEKTKLAEQFAIMEAFPELGMVCGAVRYWSSWYGGNDVIVPTGHVPNAIVFPPEATSFRIVSAPPRQERKRVQLEI